MIKYAQITEIPDEVLKKHIDAYFDEDLPQGDLTS